MLIWPLAAQAQIQIQDGDATIGTIIEVEGAAFLTHGRQTMAATVDMAVYRNDKIETFDDAKMHILFIDDTELTLGEKSVLTIDEYIYDDTEEGATGGKGRYSILRGAFLFASGLMGKTEKPDIALETPYGSIGLRGTTVWGGKIDNEYGVLVEDGEVSVTTNRGRIRVQKGQGTNIRSRDSIPTFAKAWGQEKIDFAKGRVALKHRKKVRERVVARKKAHKEKIRDRRQKVREKKRGLLDEKEQKRERNKDRMEQGRENIQNRREEYKKRRNDSDRNDGAAPAQERREKRMLRRQR